MKINNLWRFATILFPSLLILLASASCTRSALHSGTPHSQKNLQIVAEDSDMIVKKIKSEAGSQKMPNQTDELYDERLDMSTPIGGEIPTSLVLINGKSSGGFPDDHFENGAIKPFSAKELKEILKRKNFIFDDVKIVKDEKSLEKYQREFGSCCHKIEIVYEIKAHPINQKGEIFEVTAQMPYYPGGEKALMAFIDQNIRYPKKMIQDSVHGRVIVYCIIEKDGSIEEFGIANNLLKDKSGNPCTDSTVKKLCEQEALRLVKMMPRWEPGKKENGEPVRVRYNIPVNFDSFSL